MELHFYGYSFESGNKLDYYIIRAFSFEHAKVIMAEYVQSHNEVLEPSDISDEDVFLLKGLDDILLDYNYITESQETISLEDLEREWDDSGEDVYGVVGDTFM